MGQFGIGQPVRRKEDTRLLTGRGQFTDDMNFEGQVFAAFTRSPHANAKILGVDVSSALDMPGVIAVYTGADLEAAGGAAMARRRGRCHCSTAVPVAAGQPLAAGQPGFQWQPVKC